MHRTQARTCSDETQGGEEGGGGRREREGFDKPQPGWGSCRFRFVFFGPGFGLGSEGGMEAIIIIMGREHTHRPNTEKKETGVPLTVRLELSCPDPSNTAE